MFSAASELWEVAVIPTKQNDSTGSAGPRAGTADCAGSGQAAVGGRRGSSMREEGKAYRHGSFVMWRRAEENNYKNGRKKLVKALDREGKS